MYYYDLGMLDNKFLVTFRENVCINIADRKIVFFRQYHTVLQQNFKCKTNSAGYVPRIPRTNCKKLREVGARGTDESKQ